MIESKQTVILSWRQRCDLELLANGAFAPLKSYMGADDYRSVVQTARLKNGSLSPIPIVLDLSKEQTSSVGVGSVLTLVNLDSHPLASLRVTEVFPLDPAEEALRIYQTRDLAHAGVLELVRRGPYAVAGVLEVNEESIRLAAACDFPPEYMRPNQIRFLSKSNNLIAFQTRNPLHWAHITATRKALELFDDQTKLLIHPAVGPTKQGDFSVPQRMRAYRAALSYYPLGRTVLSPLPIAMRMAGPREALWHALIRKNYGATHFIIGRGHADPGSPKGGLFYPPFAAHEYVGQYSHEIGITPIFLPEFVYSKAKKSYIAESETTPEDILRLSGTEFRHRMTTNEDIPDWFSPPEVVRALHSALPSGYGKGLVVWFTGLPASGKSTLARMLVRYLEAVERCPIFLLDGDVVRRRLSKGLGFSKSDRDENIRRIGLAAQQAILKGGMCVVAAVSPYQEARDKVRRLIEKTGGVFIEIFVNTPVNVCMARDPKGIYAKAMSGTLAQMTGVNDVYETPSHPDVVIDTHKVGPDEALGCVIKILGTRGIVLKDKVFIRILEKNSSEIS